MLQRLRQTIVANTDRRRESPPATEGVRLPPAQLRYYVHNTADPDGYLAAGRQGSHDLIKALGSVGEDVARFRRVLDFGCGTGRTLLWFPQHLPDATFFGTDVDEQAIGWCRANLPFGQYDTNDLLPPTRYTDGQFDLAYAISVFTHLDEEPHLQWLAEMRRILMPGGILIATFHGQYYLDRRPMPLSGFPDGLPEPVVAELRRRGFLYTDSAAWRTFFPNWPDWNPAAFHTPDYVRQHWSTHFEILAHIPMGMSRHQDVVVLRRTPAGG